VKDIDRFAERALGIEELRPGQREAVAAVVEGRDLLAVMPTGYGKSAIYQLAGAAVDGPTVVVSPLVALQHDQVESLAEQQAGEAAQVNASVGDKLRVKVFDSMRKGEMEFVFLAPEQLARSDTLEALRRARPSLFVVDEAHCISSWGHDFRPDYLRLGDVIEALGHPTVIALTATAAPPVREEIVRRLGLRDPRVVVQGFDRPNIHLSVERFADAATKDGALADRALVGAAGGRAGIVYMGTRKRVEELAGTLCSRGVEAAPYHAGLARGRRDEVHERFMGGDVRVVVATTAFGMGVDKPDVRFVLHGDVAESLDAYYQEIGRGGRDGEPAEAVLFYRPEDLNLRRFLGASGKVTPDQLQQVAEALRGPEAAHTVDELEERLEMNRRRLTLVLSRLADAGMVDVDADGVVTTDGRAVEAVESAVHDGEARESLERSRLEMMRSYAETRTCRRRFLLTYFGEPFDRNCGYCDTCQAGLAAEPAHVGEGMFRAGARVRHAEWGDGGVIRTEDDSVTVLFDQAGYRTLSLRLVGDNGLLEPLA
jgi:ATP-dependent DNA helicase RecQ